MTDQSQRQTVYTQLRADILDGSFPQGYDLNERAIAELVGTSRTPVREAVAQLVLDGLAERRGRRTRVTVWDDEKTGQLYEIRAVLESEACRLAAMRRSESVVVKLSKLVAEQRELEDPPPALRREVNYQFHHEIWASNGNAFLLEANHKYGVQSMCIVPTTLRGEERWQQSLDEHEKLVQHIDRHEADAAATLMRHHLEAAFRQR